MTNILKLINIGSKKLKISNILSYKIDSEILLSKVLNKKREEIILNENEIVNSKKISEFNNLIHRRSLKEPIAYILEEKEFWSKKFYVSRNSLIPRPETELMVEELVKIFRDKSISILDIGTGSGCIIISLISELRSASGLGIDISKKAISVANKNIQKYNMKGRVKLQKRSFTEIFNKKFDLIVSNPPYIMRKDLKNLDEDIKRFEPLLALDGGNDGLDVIRKIIYKARYILKTKGTLALEIGNEQYKKVSKILVKNNFKIVKIIEDNKDSRRCIISSRIS